MFGILQQRAHYWSCSKLANRIRGTEKPRSATSKGWKDWEAEAKAAHPIRFWIAEEGLDHVQRWLCLPYDIYREIRAYVRNRWINKIHMLDTGLKPGQYMDLDCRILYANFNELKKFVEGEKAFMHLAAENMDKKRPWWKPQRRPTQAELSAAGLAHLEWEMALTYDLTMVEADDPRLGLPTRQAAAAREIRDLYLWWVNVRLKRDEDDWSHEAEEKNTMEDTAMLVRLMQIREDLWT